MHTLLGQCEGFDWDEDNTHKSERKHAVTWVESEQIFFNKPLIISDDLAHGENEDRFLALGRTDLNRKLFLVFTARKKLIRVISARDMTKHERAHYETRH